MEPEEVRTNGIAVVAVAIALIILALIGYLSGLFKRWQVLTTAPITNTPATSTNPITTPASPSDVSTTPVVLPPADSSTAPGASAGSATTTFAGGNYHNDKYNFSLNYSTTTFTASDLTNGVDLKSPYYVIDNPSGDPAREKRFYFEINASVANTDLLATAKQVLGSSFSSVFPEGTLASFQNSPGFAERFTLQNKNGFNFLMGIEGTNTRTVILPMASGKTMVIQETYITDFLHNAIKPEPIAEAAETQLFTQVLQSLRFS